MIAHGSAVEFDESGAAEHIDHPKDKVVAIPKWSTWKEYIANHKDMSKIIEGGGIVRVTAEFLQGTSDPNRAGRKRCDFICYCTDSSYWRLHPGSKRSLDAAPRHMRPQVFTQVLQSTAGSIWMPTQFTLPFTATQASTIPQTDRMGKKEVWAWIQNLGAAEHEFDITNGNDFKWWLWVATLEQSHGVVKAGISTAALKTNGERYARFDFGRTDGSNCTVTIMRRRDGQIVLEVNN